MSPLASPSLCTTDTQQPAAPRAGLMLVSLSCYGSVQWCRRRLWRLSLHPSRGWPTWLWGRSDPGGGCCCCCSGCLHSPAQRGLLLGPPLPRSAMPAPAPRRQDARGAVAGGATCCRRLKFALLAHRRLPHPQGLQLAGVTVPGGPALGLPPMQGGLPPPSAASSTGRKEQGPAGTLMRSPLIANPLFTASPCD